MSQFTNENLALLLHIYNHGQITMDEFKEEFPKIIEPSNRLHKLVRAGVLRRIGSQFLVTTRGRDVLKDSGHIVVSTTSMAKPRNFTKGGTYDGQRMTPMRAGAEDHLRIPSLIGGQHIYRKDVV